MITEVVLKCAHVIYYELPPDLKDVIYCTRCNRATSVVKLIRNGKERISRHA
jgi:hypothetical protein